MTDGLPALLPLALLEAVQNIDTPPDDGLGALEDELAAKRLGLSRTVAAQIARYRTQADAGDEVGADEVLAVFRLVGRRPDAALVYADAGRRAGRYAARKLSAARRALLAGMPAGLRRTSGMRSACRLSRRWLQAELRYLEGEVRAEMLTSPALEARDDGTGCLFYSAAFAELLRVVAGYEGVIGHDACRARGDRACVWRAQPQGEPG